MNCIFAGLFAGVWIVFMAWVLWVAARVKADTAGLVEECEARAAKAKRKQPKEESDDN